MKTVLKYGIFVAVFVALTITGYSDTLLLKNGVSQIFSSGFGLTISTAIRMIFRGVKNSPLSPLKLAPTSSS